LKMERKIDQGLYKIITGRVAVAGKAFVFDTSAFDYFRRNKALLYRLRMRVDDPIFSADRLNEEKLEEDCALEGRYLSTLAQNMKDFNNFFISSFVVKELEDYYEEINRAVKSSNTAEIKVHVSPFLGGVEELINASRKYGIPRVHETIERNRLKFLEYLNKWISLPKISDSVSDESEREIKQRRHDMNTTDKVVLALAFTLAWERPTMLFTNDIGHIGRVTNEIYGRGVYWKSFSELPKRPKYAVKVYIDDRVEGWKRWNLNCSRRSK
jgi:hypothetical protein